MKKIWNKGKRTAAGLWRVARRCDPQALTAQASFFLMLSIFPIMVTVGAIMPFLHIPPEDVAPWLGGVLPQPVLEIVEPEITDLLTNSSTGFLSLGIVGILWSAASVMRTFQSAFDKLYSLKCSNCLVSSTVLPVLTIIVVILFALGFVAAAGFGESLISKMMNDAVRAESVLRSMGHINNILSLILGVLLFGAIYRLIPNVRLTVRETVPGAVTAAVGFLIVNRLFASYIDFMLHPGESFGARGAMAAYQIITALFTIGLWMRLICYVILAGAVINAYLHQLFRRPTVQKVIKADRLLQRLIKRFKRK